MPWMGKYPDSFHVVVKLRPGQRPDDRGNLRERSVGALLREKNVDLKFNFAVAWRGIDQEISRRERFADFPPQFERQAACGARQELEWLVRQQLINRAMMVERTFDDPFVNLTARAEDPLQQWFA